MRATLYQHPLAHVVFDEVKPFDPREQDVQPVTEQSVIAAVDANNAERAAARAKGARLTDVNYPAWVLQKRQEELTKLDGLEAIHRLIAEHGAEQIARWVKSAAAMQGQPIEGV